MDFKGIYSRFLILSLDKSQITESCVKEYCVISKVAMISIIKTLSL